jgi:signal transduction histidine kinase
LEDDSREKRVLIETESSGDRLEIRIVDNGPGIPEEIKDKIFGPLFSTKSFGVGLGIPIVKTIMEGHNGGIVIESGEKKGTTVSLWLPVTT